MKSSCTWTGGSRPTEPHVSTAIESQPEVWMRRDDSSLPGSRVNGSQSGNLFKLTQWPIENYQLQQQPPPSTPRRSSLESDHSSAAARIIPLTRWPLSDPRGGRRAMFDTGIPRRITTENNRYVSDPCSGRQNSDLKFTKKDHDRNTTEVRALKTNLFPLDDTHCSEEDNICVVKDGDRESVNTNMFPPAKSDSSAALLKDIDTFGAKQHPVKDIGLSTVNQCPSSVTDLTEAHQHSLMCTDLLDELSFPLKDTECSSREEHKVCLQGKRGGEKCARLMSRLCHLKRSKQHDNVC